MITFNISDPVKILCSQNPHTFWYIRAHLEVVSALFRYIRDPVSGFIAGFSRTSGGSFAKIRFFPGMASVTSSSMMFVPIKNHVFTKSYRWFFSLDSILCKSRGVFVRLNPLWIKSDTVLPAEAADCQTVSSYVQVRYWSHGCAWCESLGSTDALLFLALEISA